MGEMGGAGVGVEIIPCYGPIHLDKVFVSVYAITETNTTYAEYGTSDRGSSPCFE